MAQKLILCEASVGQDILQYGPVASAIAEGYEVSDVSCYSTRDNRDMCAVLLAEAAAEVSESEQEGGTSEGETSGTSEGETSGTEGG